MKKNWFEVEKCEFVNGEWKETKVANIISKKHSNQYYLTEELIHFMKTFAGEEKIDKGTRYIGTGKEWFADKDTIQQIPFKEYQRLKEMNAISEDGTLNKEKVFYFISLRKEISKTKLKILKENKSIPFYDFE